MQILKILVSLLVSIMPFNLFRVFLLNFIFSYKICYKTKIGYLNIILAKEVNISKTIIGSFNYINIKKLSLRKIQISNFNLIHNFSTLVCKNSSLIGSYNIIYGHSKKAGFLRMNESQFTTSHTIEVFNEFILQKNVVFGGINSKINIGKSKKKTLVCNNVYFGSSIYMSSGIKIIKKTLIGSGSVVLENINRSGLYVSHSLIKIK